MLPADEATGVYFHSCSSIGPFGGPYVETHDGQSFQDPLIA